MIVNVLTRKADASKKRKKEIAFLLRMEGYKTQVKDHAKYFDFENKKLHEIEGTFNDLLHFLLQCLNCPHEPIWRKMPFPAV